MSRDPRAGLQDCSGFTLLELMIALTIGATLVLGARALLVQLADSADRVVDAAAVADRAANAERLLRDLVAQAALDEGDGARFTGDERASRFVTWCDVPAGWKERCLVTIGVVRSPNGLALVAGFPDGDVVVLRDGLATATLRYLYRAEGGGVWLPSWNSTVAIPLAVGAVLEGDTLILRIGARG